MQIHQTRPRLLRIKQLPPLAVVPPDEEIPAHLLDDVSNQSSISLHRLLSLPDRESDDFLTRSLQRKEINSVDIVNLGREFFDSLGLDPLQSTFWNQSIFVSPINEEGYCAVRAWNVDLASDVRLKVCGRISGENFIGIYRSLGEVYFIALRMLKTFCFGSEIRASF